MRIFKKRKEERSQTYVDQVIQQVMRNAGKMGLTALPGATSAIEICSGIIERSFTSASIVSNTSYIKEALTPTLMAYIARSLAKNGECLLALDTKGTQSVRLIPVSDYTVTGTYDPDTWKYTVTLAGPSETREIKNKDASRFLHFTWATELARPWKGIGPIQSATLDGAVLAELVKLLADEASGARGYFLPIPRTDGQDSTVQLLRQDIRSAEGKALLVESMSDGWQSGSRGQVNHDWQQRRFGMDIPETLVALMKAVHNQVISTYGIPPQIFTSEGSSVRETWRVILFGLLKPLSKRITDEITAKLGIDVSFDFSEIRASDLQGRARAYKSLVDGGMSDPDARTFAGFNN